VSLFKTLNQPAIEKQVESGTYLITAKQHWGTDGLGRCSAAKLVQVLSDQIHRMIVIPQILIARRNLSDYEALMSIQEAFHCSIKCGTMSNSGHNIWEELPKGLQLVPNLFNAV
jgi:hypothetical protein